MMGICIIKSYQPVYQIGVSSLRKHGAMCEALPSTSHSAGARHAPSAKRKAQAQYHSPMDYPVMDRYCITSICTCLQNSIHIASIYRHE